MAQISHRTGFLLQSDDPANQVVNTGSAWKVMQDSAYAQIIYKDNDPHFNGITMLPDRANGWMRPSIRGDGSNLASTIRTGCRRRRSIMQLRRALKATSAGNSSRAPCRS